MREAKKRLFEEKMRVGVQLEDAVLGHGGPVMIRALIASRARQSCNSDVEAVSKSNSIVGERKPRLSVPVDK